jgi:hypothetical protein
MNLVCAWGENEETCRLAENVVNYCIAKLMPRMRTLDVCIQIEEDCDALGYCLAVNPREFVIEVKEDLDTYTLIETLAHECVHIKQYARKELAIDGKMEYKTQEEYLSVWYEREAYQLEGALAKWFIEEYYK